MHLNDIRKAFLEFFKKHDHTVLPSSLLVPQNDPSLMFTNSGMVQFKNCFLGSETPINTRVATSQKCVRAGGKHNDLDNVGYTARHHTFFEMLGNFSFGDYFKDEAIEFAWEFLTRELGIDKKKLYITVYYDDEDAYSIWKKVAGLSDDRIIKISTSDNFWSMGNTGPCGPCSEIFYDHGDQYEGGLPGSDNEGDRYVEIWNLVFMQYEQYENGEINKLPKPSIDTGIGLERLTAVMQGVNSNFDIDLFQELITESIHITGKTENITPHKVIADHLRSMSFLIADGVLPSNDGRGYVLRRIMRRAMRYVKNLGYKKPLLHQLVSSLVSLMGNAYPELHRAEQNIKSILQYEEEKFSDTLEKGMKILNDEVKKVKKSLPGDVAFKLYDTYGFPLDLTKDILRSRDIEIDEEGFAAAMAEQKQRARKAWVGSGEKEQEKIWFEIAEKYEPTEFSGYVYDSLSAKVIAIISDGKSVECLKKGQTGIVILNQTPFYGESGGQVGDTGFLYRVEERICTVKDTIIYPKKIFGHHITCDIDHIAVGDDIIGVVDAERRNKTRANHSATHLLHNTLHKLLGDHVVQKGSLVNDQKLRFDFSHTKALTAKEISEIEFVVNKMIRSNADAVVEIMPYDQAIQSGAMALFGEKYSDEVRVISMGNSVELCGGTHVKRTGDIGVFKIISETAISSGVRRIEAVTGIAALQYYDAKCKIVHDVSSTLRCNNEQILEKIFALIDDKKTLVKKLNDLTIQKITDSVEETNFSINTENVTFITGKCNDIDAGVMRNAISGISQKFSKKPYIIILYNKYSGIILVAVSKSLHRNDVDAKLLGQFISEELDGKGGGSKDLFQIGGIKNVESIDTLAKMLIEKLQSNSLVNS